MTPEHWTRSPVIGALLSALIAALVSASVFVVSSWGATQARAQRIEDLAQEVQSLSAQIGQMRNEMDEYLMRRDGH